MYSPAQHAKKHAGKQAGSVQGSCTPSLVSMSVGRVAQNHSCQTVVQKIAVRFAYPQPRSCWRVRSRHLDRIPHLASALARTLSEAVYLDPQPSPSPLASTRTPHRLPPDAASSLYTRPFAASCRRKQLRRHVGQVREGDVSHSGRSCRRGRQGQGRLHARHRTGHHRRRWSQWIPHSELWPSVVDLLGAQ